MLSLIYINVHAEKVDVLLDGEHQGVGSITAYRGQFPWQVAVRVENYSYFCGGSVISSQWVLTAAHCM
jgi:secreted trypsin-like serine protease